MGPSHREPTPYGAWTSPISARSVAEGARRIDDIAAAGACVCWIERRPDEGGRNVLVCRRPNGATETLTPAGYDVRSRVHEYGGGAFCLLAGAPAAHAFVNFQDQRVYLVAGAGPPIPLTPADGAHYADLTPDPHRRRLIAVQERPDPAGGEEIAALVAIPLPAAAPAPDSPAPDRSADSQPPTELVSGADFYSSPRLSPDGSKLAWLSWNHPDMPWDATELRLADLDESGLPVAPRLVAGGDAAPPEAVQQPSFDAHEPAHLRLRPQRLVEPLPPRQPRHAPNPPPPPTRRRVRHAPLALRHVHLRPHRLGHRRRLLRPGRVAPPLPPRRRHRRRATATRFHPVALHLDLLATPRRRRHTHQRRRLPRRRPGPARRARPALACRAAPPAPPPPPAPKPPNSKSSPPPGRPRTPATSRPAGRSTSRPPAAAAPSPSSTRRRTTTSKPRPAPGRPSSSRATAVPPLPPSTSTTPACSTGPRAASRWST